ncbi:MAG: hypothetical protein F9K41_17495 [Sphingopyxis terrae]|nr:MAG: hypothetical protein F9K41_17495 [Sphingopyxis terrae]PWB83552.1 MAG: hypothetical protein C3F11_05900 [Methylocystaceae bacterium]
MLSDRELDRAIGAVEREHLVDGERDLDASWDDSLDRLRVLMLEKAPSPEEGLPALMPKLARLDRYERRALSRRNRAMRKFDAPAPATPAPPEFEGI